MTYEIVESITGSGIPLSFDIKYTVEESHEPKLLHSIVMRPRCHTPEEPKILINDKPYWCGCSRVFTYDSFNKEMARIIKVINEEILK